MSLRCCGIHLCACHFLLVVSWNSFCLFQFPGQRGPLQKLCGGNGLPWDCPHVLRQTCTQSVAGSHPMLLDLCIQAASPSEPCVPLSSLLSLMRVTIGLDDQSSTALHFYGTAVPSVIHISRPWAEQRENIKLPLCLAD
jgi:hypothetical protein